MPIDSPRARALLRGADFRTLFREELGWDRLATQTAVPAGDQTYTVTGIANKRGVHVLVCESPDGLIPDRARRGRIDTAVRRVAHEHLLIFVNSDRTEQLWQWATHEPGRSVAIREHRYHVSQPGDALLEKLEHLAIPLSDEEELTLTEVRVRAVEAFGRRDKVTKKFFDRFQREHRDFLGFIGGIDDVADREWYASVMLNRLMFIYFIQRKRFLDGDPNYLRTKLALVRTEHGEGQFLTFYRRFLLRLFHEGLATGGPRGAELDELLGSVPYLNGGIFEVHHLEADYGGIDIADEAFERIFAFFDDYQWHLDDRPLRDDSEINPDVLGYIFEKYINQKQMGAYYTKEDITEYISKNTVLPFLLDATREDCRVAFQPNGSVWRLLRDDPNRYIYPAVLKGVDVPLPEDIEAGIADVSKRGGWNRPAAPEFALPTETWREHVARRTRCLELREKLAAGDINEVNDLITLNLNIRQFAQDVIERSEGPEVVRAFYKALAQVSVLDPTCGSGAFLFAALNILQPLYDACLDRMQAWLEDQEQLNRPAGRDHFFRTTLEHAAMHPNREYFVLKSIIIGNLYGVDIMEEAVEICKLRLFLKLVAQIEDVAHLEPLPDIDFNIRAGNTLVGFTSLDAVREAMSVDSRGNRRLLFEEDEQELKDIEESAALADLAYQRFRDQQTEYGGLVTAADKAELRRRLEELDEQLDRHLARQYGVDADNAGAFDAWRASHQPFHWFVEFNGVMSRGGFDATVGNPPYVASAAMEYDLRSPAGERFPDIYANVVLRSETLTIDGGRCSMIVPLSITFGTEFRSLRQRLFASGVSWFSSFDNIPAALFSGVSQRCTIWLAAKQGSTAGAVFTAPMLRWRADYRPVLVANLTYALVPEDVLDEGWLPKVGPDSLKSWATLVRQSTSGGRPILRPGRAGGDVVGFSPAARNFISVFLEAPPTLNVDTLQPGEASTVNWTSVVSSQVAFAAIAVLASDTFFWYWLVRGDGFHVTSGVVNDFVSLLSCVDEEGFALLAGLGQQLHRRRFEALQFKKNAGKYVGNFNYRRVPELAIHADFVLLASLGMQGSEAEAVLDYVRRVLALNEQAGEKGISREVHSRYRELAVDQLGEEALLHSARNWASSRLGLNEDRLGQWTKVAASDAHNLAD